MKKLIERIFGIAIILFLCYNNRSYAYFNGSYDIYTSEFLKNLLLPFGIIIFAPILFYILFKYKIKNSKKKEQIHKEKQHEERNKIFSIGLLLLTMLVTIVLFVIYKNFFPNILILLIIIMFIIAIIFRALNKKMLSYIIYVIVTSIFCVSLIYSNTLKSEGYIVKQKFIRTYREAQDSRVTFNNQWKFYEGKKEYSFAKALYSAISANNAKLKLRLDSSLRFISMSGIITIDENGNDINNNINSLDETKLYNIKLTYDNSGWVKAVHIEEAK